MAVGKEVAKFAAGICAAETALHAALVAGSAKPRTLRKLAAPRAHLLQLAAAALGALLLAWYAWRQPTYPRLTDPVDNESVV